MSLAFLRETPEIKLRKIENDLSTINEEFNFSTFSKLPIQKVQKCISYYNGKIGTLKESTYGSWLFNPKFNEFSLIREGLLSILEKKQSLIDNEQLVRGFVYYNNVKHFDKQLVGERCFYKNNFDADWVPFKEHIAVTKAKELLRYGSEEDFKKIYFEFADGNSISFGKVDLSHVSESTDSALEAIEEYCDSRWNGPWAWEAPSSEKLMMVIEDKKMDLATARKKKIDLAKQITSLYEEQMDKFALVGAIQDMQSRVDSMIADVGKIMSDSIELGVAAQTTPGTGNSNLHGTIEAPANNVAQGLAQLKAAIQNALGAISANVESPTLDGLDPTMGNDGGAPGAVPGAEGGLPPAPTGDMGLGGDPAALGDTLSGVGVEGEDGERIKKDM